MKQRKVFALALVLVLALSVESFAVEFGRYYKDAREMSPIEWRVLDENDNAMLLIAENCLDGVPYNERRENVTWETCTLRKWLNNEFLSTAFTDSEQAAIILSDLPANHGNPTRDKIFVLNADEAIKYMPSESSRQCSPTNYARRRGVYSNESGLCAWWTRSPGQNNSQASYLSSYGSLGRRQHYVNDDVIGVRPALWVSKSFIEAEEILFSAKPTPEKAQEAETTLFPLMEQKSPFGVEEVYSYFLANPNKALNEFDRKRFEVQGVVLRTGPDGVFGQPCIELSDRNGGKCYVLCIFQNANSYRSIKAGDKISVRGNYLVIRRDYGIVLKICELI